MTTEQLDRFRGAVPPHEGPGVDAIEIHQTVFEQSLNEDLDTSAIERAQSGYFAELGMTVTACNINTWTPKFRLGGPELESCAPAGRARRGPERVEIYRIMKIPVHHVREESTGTTVRTIHLPPGPDPAIECSMINFAKSRSRPCG